TDEGDRWHAPNLARKLRNALGPEIASLYERAINAEAHAPMLERRARRAELKRDALERKVLTLEELVEALAAHLHALSDERRRVTEREIVREVRQGAPPEGDDRRRWSPAALAHGMTGRHAVNEHGDCASWCEAC